MTLTQLQKDLVFGTLLGDGNLITETQGKTWRYRALQAEKHAEYLDHKYLIMKDLCKTGPKPSSTYDKRTEKTYYRNSFSTLTNPCFKVYGDIFYTPVDGKMVKDVPLNFKEFLTPRAVAYWYMDDGSLKSKNTSNAMRICTEGFSVEGVERLREALLDLYQIPTSRTRKDLKRKGHPSIVRYRIGINEKASAAFRELIRPYLVDCMKYKVSDGNKGHL